MTAGCECSAAGRVEAATNLPSLGKVNVFPATFDPAWQPATGLIVGHDVVGGVFALNGRDPAAAGRPGLPGQMTYFAPDTLEWEAMDLGHSAWISWLVSDRLETFYEGLRWPGWREEAAALTFSQGITVFPFLWSKEAHEDLAATSRRAVPMREVLGVAEALAMPPPRAAFLRWRSTTGIRLRGGVHITRACRDLAGMLATRASNPPLERDK